MRIKRILAGVLVAAMAVLLFPGVALGADGILVVTINGSTTATIYETGGTAQIPLVLETSNEDITISAIIASNPSGKAFVIRTDFTSPVKVSKGVPLPLVLESTISDAYPSRTEENITYEIYHDGDNSPTAITVAVRKTSKGVNETDSTPSTSDDEPTTTPGDVPLLLMLSPVDANGYAVSAPSGNCGDSVKLRLPILNRGGYYDSVASQIIVTPEISASLDNFPFVVEAVDYSRSIRDLKPGEIQETSYNFKLSKDVKSGVKEVKFNCVYYNRYKQEYETSKFSVFVTVIKGKEDDEGIKDADGETITTQPKIIIESSSLTPDAPQEDDEEGRLYAGEPFTLKMTIRNTSSEEAVKNIQVTLSNEGNVIIPANNGSNSLYIDKIEPGGSVEREVKLQAAPDAEPKSQNLTVKFAYESSKTLKGYSESQDIAVPILQRVRVRMNDPIIYGDGMVDQEISISLSAFNLSKSTLYYCSVDIEGDGLRMAEPFYYGNVAGGGSMQADFNIIPSQEGNIEGIVVLTFEDAYNKQTRLEKPFTLNVMAGFGGGMDFGDGGMMPDMEQLPVKSGPPTWLIITLCAAGAVLLIGILVVVRRRRRKKELTDSL